MAKCFFYLELGSRGPMVPLGLFCLDQPTACAFAQTVADDFTRNGASTAFAVVVKDQSGDELGRARPTEHRR